jgi:Transposase DDE domain
MFNPEDPLDKRQEDPNQPTLPFPSEGRPTTEEPAQNAPAPSPVMNRQQAQFAGRKAVKEAEKAKRAAEAEKRKAEAAERKALKKSEKRRTPKYAALTGKPYEMPVEELHNRLVRGVDLFDSFKAGVANVLFVQDGESELTIWFSSSDSNAAYRVWRQIRNLRGVTVVDYRCSCPDFTKMGRADCLHIFAERLRRDEVRVVGKITEEQHTAAKERRPPRKLFGADGRALCSIRRTAREQMPDRVPELIRMLGDVYPSAQFDRFDGPKAERMQVERAIALLHKVCQGASSEAMRSVYRYLIADGRLGLLKSPHPNSISRWINDAEITPILEKFVRISASPFRLLESAVILDSSKFSQLETAHYRMVAYGEGNLEDRDKRPSARWMKCHALVGVESMACFAVKFSKNAKDKDDPEDAAADIRFFVALMEQALATLDVKTVLADKGYLAEWVLGWCWERGIKAIIPIKKTWDLATKTAYYEASKMLVELFENKRRVFDEMFRWRVKVEAFFSVLKRVVDGYCMSRGRPRRDPETNKMLPDLEQPLQTAWVNETLCKIIYMNLRRTVEWEERTQVRANYVIQDRVFPRQPGEAFPLEEAA